MTVLEITNKEAKNKEMKNVLIFVFITFKIKRYDMQKLKRKLSLLANYCSRNLKAMSKMPYFIFHKYVQFTEI